MPLVFLVMQQLKFHVTCSRICVQNLFLVMDISNYVPFAFRILCRISGYAAAYMVLKFSFLIMVSATILGYAATDFVTDADLKFLMEILDEKFENDK
ncbi:hypothetical protein VNO78_30978 [Psophocarpus tetragonolobus]|uniref:Uncharacterized protein n=1 Tax=Psophocarpus tetragonolobus TaxID=3891 RepID=A0AAN9RXK9_PSOTE